MSNDTITPVKTEEYRGYMLEYNYDYEIVSPREWDNLGHMICSHGRYELGDEQFDANAFNSWDEVEQYVTKKRKAVIVFPLSLIDHSGLTLVIGKRSGWDMGQVGFCYVTKQDIIDTYGKYDAATKLLAEEALRDEVDTYGHYLAGDTYAYVVRDSTGNVVDSCSGFYGLVYAQIEAMRAVDALLRQKRS